MKLANLTQVIAQVLQGNIYGGQGNMSRSPENVEGKRDWVSRKQIIDTGDDLRMYQFGQKYQ